MEKAQTKLSRSQDEKPGLFDWAVFGGGQI